MLCYAMLCYAMLCLQVEAIVNRPPVFVEKVVLTHFSFTDPIRQVLGVGVIGFFVKGDIRHLVYWGQGCRGFDRVGAFTKSRFQTEH